MRYFVEASYDGTGFVGWQIQPEGRSVQGEIQAAISTVLRSEIEIVGCGRTDAGVHAQKYVFHMDLDKAVPENFVDRLNKFLPEDIAFYNAYQVQDELHARYSAVSRTYNYYLSFVKNPLGRNTSVYLPKGSELDWDTIFRASAVIMKFGEFKPFAKTGSDVHHFKCSGLRLDWNVSENAAVLTISANRFLRGMVRLMVGALIRVGKHEISIDQVEEALQTQKPLRKAVSAPAHGLHLVEIAYPE